MAELFFPVLSHFLNKNPWSASLGRLRFRVIPSFPEEGEPILTAELWEGPWAYEFSTVEETRTFPLTEEGLVQLPQWLEEKAREVNARPERTLEENIARRVEPSAPEGDKEKK